MYLGDGGLIKAGYLWFYFCIFVLLQIINKDDPHWWQARHDAAGGSAGLIPSPELQEWRIACQSADKSNPEQGLFKMFLKIFLIFACTFNFFYFF